jgi:hypothetical protein
MRNWLRRLTPIALFLTSSAIRLRSNENRRLPFERSTRSIYAREPPNSASRRRAKSTPTRLQVAERELKKAATGRPARGKTAPDRRRKAAAMQISPMLYSRQDTVEKVEKKIHQPGGQGVQLRNVEAA